ncbi:MAG: SH3 domain-containing protein [Anaerolineae bacterium]|nr:SH3 domain-containing protein [Anaerolineae bacterium]
MMQLNSPQRRIVTLLLPVVALLLGACNLLTAPDGGGQQSVISGAPVVQIVSPAPNATFREGVAVPIQALISNAGADIDRVEIVVNGSIVATLPKPNTANTPSFSITQSWQPGNAGQYTLGVTAFRADGSSSAPVTVTVTIVGQGAQPTPTNTVTSGQQAQPTPAGQQTQPTNPPQPTTAGQQTQPTAAPQQPTDPPPPSATPSNPTVTTTQGVNLRRGPGTEFAPPVGSMPANATADIVAVNPARTWYKVRSSFGEGWITAQYVTVSGDTNNIPVDVGPPTPVPATATFTPVPATATPITQVNLFAGNIRIDPASAPCFPPGQGSFNIYIDVANLGTSANTVGGTISVQDVLASNGAEQGRTQGAFGILQPGQTVASGPIPLTISTNYGQQHKLILIVDAGGAVPETNENDNRAEFTFTLSKGTCP